MPPRRRQADNEDENEPEQVPNPDPRAESVFLKHNPPLFNGLGDPMDAKKWVHSLEHIFDFIACSEEEKEFNQFSRHAPHLVDTDGKKARKFKKGLRSEIGIALAGQEDMSYARTLAKALSIEAILPREKVQPPQSANDPKGKRNRESGVLRSQPDNTPNIRPCQKCGMMHLGVCRGNQTGCYNYDEEGHFKMECPKGNNRRSQTPQQLRYPQPLQQFPGNQPRLQPPQPASYLCSQGQSPPQLARTYALNQQQATKAPGNLAGTITHSKTPVLALFDTGASHSFIAESVCKKLKIKPENAENALEISIPSGKRMTSRKVCTNLELNIEGENIKSNLYVIKIQDFDIIIGMDWLASAYASIRCPEREVVFRPPGKPENVISKEEIVLNEDLAYEEKPQAIVDRKIQKLRNKEISLVKVIWNHHGSEEVTWELESELLKKYPDIAYHG
ncbi:hypothetical protein C2S52_014076 [Perilla frutescens var. hirtella]|nr:hypothetical protein C2S52_014076 [Perilla frutescens var. hirtella]